MSTGDWTIAELRAAVATGETSAREVCDAYLNRITGRERTAPMRSRSCCKTKRGRGPRRSTVGATSGETARCWACRSQ